MDIDSIKKALEKARESGFVSFLFFLLVSCVFWFILTLNRMYETDISVSVNVKNLPQGVSLENDGCVPLRAMVRGEGTDLFGFIFKEGVDVAVDYSEMKRNGGRLSMSSGVIHGRVNEKLGPSLTLKSILADSVVAMVQRATAVVPVRRSHLDLSTAEGCELVSVEYYPKEVRVTALVDEIATIKDVRVPTLSYDGLHCDTVLELEFLPGGYIDVKPERLEVRVGVSRYVGGSIAVPVEYVGFPSDIDLGFMPLDVDVEYEVLEVNAGKVKPADFSVQLRFDDYAHSVVVGKAGDLEKKFAVSAASPFVRNARVVGVEAQLPDSSFIPNATAL